MDSLPAPPALRPLFVFAALVVCFGFSACQCSWKPDVGPVEGEEDAQLRLEAPAHDAALAEAAPVAALGTPWRA